MANRSIPSTSKRTSSTSISVSNLQLPSGILGPDVWGESKPQPASISLTLNLRRDFDSAASLDVLDESTIHYGQLCKRVRAACAGSQSKADANTTSSSPPSIEEVLVAGEGAVIGMARKADGKFVVRVAKLEVGLPKASVYGAGARVVDEHEYGEDGKVVASWRTVGWRAMRVMVLVGVHAYERRGRQPLVVEVDFGFQEKEEGDLAKRTETLLRLERKVAEILEDTAFETLESLSHFALKHIRDLLRSVAGSEEISVRLRLEKPCAIPFADAPAVEVFSTGEEKSRSYDVDDNDIQETTSQLGSLSIIKPYA